MLRKSTNVLPQYQVFDDDDPRRYHKSTMDMRRRGLGLAGVASTAIAMPASSTTAALANTDMELAASWTNGARSSSQAHGGTYSWLLSTAVTTAYQDATTWTTAWRGRAFTLSGWI